MLTNRALVYSHFLTTVPRPQWKLSTICYPSSSSDGPVDRTGSRPMHSMKCETHTQKLATRLVGTYNIRRSCLWMLATNVLLPQRLIEQIESYINYKDKQKRKTKPTILFLFVPLFGCYGSTCNWTLTTPIYIVLDLAIIYYISLCVAFLPLPACNYNQNVHFTHSFWTDCFTINNKRKWISSTWPWNKNN